jgi:hypothetical protein
MNPRKLTAEDVDMFVNPEKYGHDEEFHTYVAEVRRMRAADPSVPTVAEIIKQYVLKHRCS